MVIEVLLELVDVKIGGSPYIESRTYLVKDAERLVTSTWLEHLLDVLPTKKG